MPMTRNGELTPDEAVAHGYCPECGKDLALTTADLEIIIHWPRGLSELVASPEAIRRAKLIRGYFMSQEAPH